MSAAEPVLADFSTDKRVLWLAVLAFVVGSLGAFAAAALLWLINLFTNLAFFARLSAQPVTPEGNHLGLFVVIVPVIGALIIGLMARFGSEKIRGHGIPEALEAILLGQSRIEPKMAFLKPLSSALSIGTGGPFGAEGPIIMTAGALGSLLGQGIHLSANERKTLLVAGAAAGMSAVFATPLAAILFAVELLLFEWKPRSLIPVAIASMTAMVWRLWLLGSGPIFPIAHHPVIPINQLPGAMLVGLVAGIGSCLLTLLVYGCEDAFQRLPIQWMWWPALGAIAVGLGGLIDPRILGVGYDSIHALLRGDLQGGKVLTLVLLKGVIWAIALGSGTSGGVLAPLLMLGSGIGLLTGQLIQPADPALWALVGTVAMMGGTMRAPFTAVIFVIELTHDFNALPELVAGVFVALTITVLVMRRSILTEKLARRGHHISREYSVDLFDVMRVAEVMDPHLPAVREDTLLGQLAAEIGRGEALHLRRHGLLVLNERDELVGVITRGDVFRAVQKGKEELRVGEIAAGTPIVTYPNELLRDATGKMLSANIGRLPVVDPANPRRAIGYIGRAELLRARLKHFREENEREPGWLRVG